MGANRYSEKASCRFYARSRAPVSTNFWRWLERAKLEDVMISISQWGRVGGWQEGGLKQGPARHVEDLADARLLALESAACRAARLV